MDPEKITLDLGKFDPTSAELMQMVEATKGITATDLKDKGQLEIVKQNRITLKNARVQIEKTGKSLRDPATAFSKKVSAREKELVAIIEPEEERLVAIEEEAKQLAIKEERMEKLPARKERLDLVVGESPTPMEYAVDSELLDMDAEAFESYFNQKVAEKNENVRIEGERAREAKQKEIDAENARIKAEQDAKQAELDEKQRKIDDEKREIQHAKEVEKAAKKAREEAELKAKEEAEKKEADRLAEEKRAMDEKIAADRKAEEEKKAEEARLAKEKKYTAFIKKIGYVEESDEFFKVVKGTTIIFYKKVGEYDSSN